MDSTTVPGDPGAQDPGAGGDPKEPVKGKESEDGRVTQARTEAISERQKRQEAETRTKELETKLKEYEDAKLSETEKLQNAASENERGRILAEQALQEERLSRAIERAASKVGFIDPEDAVLAVDRSLIKVGKDGRPEPAALDAALKTLAEAKPHLVGNRAGSGDGGARRSSPAGSDMNALIREKAGLGS